MQCLFQVRTMPRKKAPLAPEPTEEGRITDTADAVDAANEDVPIRPAPKKNLPRFKQGHDNDNDAEGCHCYDSSFPKGTLPPPPNLRPRELEESEIAKPKKGKDGVDLAMETLDEYYEGVPLRNPNVDHGGE
jgi:hypothetical protein